MTQDETAKSEEILEVAPADTSTKAINVYGSQSNFDSAQRMARALCSSTLVPAEYRGEKGIPNALIAMELAGRIGASVLMVMQNLDIIQGRPSWRSQFLIATVNGSKRFTPLRFQWEGEKDSDEWGCRAIATDRESGEECLGALITIQLSKDEGWYTRKGSKWTTIPEQMLMYRAAAFWARVYAPELSLGMHTTEEIIDMGSAPQSAGAAEMNEALEVAVETVDEVPVDEPQEQESDESPAQPDTTADMDSFARRSQLMRDQLLKSLERVKRANLDVWRQKSADLIESMLPEHQQLVENEIERLRTGGE